MKQENQNISDAEYRKAWDNLGKIEIKLVEKIGQCKHTVGETHIFKQPYQRPSDVCYALLHVLDLYTWRVSLGFPSWNADNRDIYRIHCPDATGTIWEIRRVE